MPLLFTFNRNELTWPVSWDATPRHTAPHTAHCALRQEAERHLHTNNATTQRAERCHDPAFYYYDVYHNDDMHNGRQKKIQSRKSHKIWWLSSTADSWMNMGMIFFIDISFIVRLKIYGQNLPYLTLEWACKWHAFLKICFLYVLYHIVCLWEVYWVSTESVKIC